MDQPHYVRPAGLDAVPADAVPADEVGAAPARSWWRRAWGRVTHLVDDRAPSEYSSLSPRRPDGSRTRLFSFNGSGRGR